MKTIAGLDAGTTGYKISLYNKIIKKPNSPTGEFGFFILC